MTTAEPDDPREEAAAAEPLDATDLALLNAVRACFDEHDPVPEGLAGRIDFALTLDALQTEAATLTRMDLAGAGARAGTESVRTVTFTSDSLTTVITVTPQQPGTVRVDGWAVPGAGVRVELELTAGVRETVADEDGRFVLDDVPTGLGKFALHLPGPAGVTVVSPAITL